MRVNTFAGFALEVAVISCLIPTAVLGSSKTDASRPVIRWEQGRTGSGFSFGADGRYSYQLSSDDLTVVLSIDSQELQKVNRRVSHFLAFYLTVHYTGSEAIDFESLSATLEFQEHYHQIHNALNSDGLATRLQEDMDALNDETRRHLRKHPDEKGAQEAKLQQRLREIAEMQEFLGTQSLLATTLDPISRDAGGWILFSTESKWIGAWKRKEHFLLRIPLQHEVLEFPLTLPPKDAKFVLRPRPND